MSAAKSHIGIVDCLLEVDRPWTDVEKRMFVRSLNTLIGMFEAGLFDDSMKPKAAEWYMQRGGIYADLHRRITAAEFGKINRELYEEATKIKKP